MRLFLSSYRLGSDRASLTRLCPPPCRVGVIANAADGWPEAAREWAVDSELNDLRALGYTPEEVDLRNFLDGQPSILPILQRHQLIWVRGGNTFVLRVRMAQCGADKALTELIKTCGVAYGGYSAGACILAPTLRGLESLDDPSETSAVCGRPAIWEGLGLIDFQIVPHYRSEGHEYPERIEELAVRYERERVPFRTLRDGETITVCD